MSPIEQRYYYTDPKFELEINLQRIRRELIYLLESCTKKIKCSDVCKCSKKLDKSAKSDKTQASVHKDAEEATTNDSGRTSPSNISTCPNLKSPSPSALPAPIWENSNEKVKLEGWLKAPASLESSGQNAIKASPVLSKRCLDFSKNPPESTKSHELSKDPPLVSPECTKENQVVLKPLKFSTTNQSHLTPITPETSGTSDNVLKIFSASTPKPSKNTEKKSAKETAVDAFFKWFKPGTSHPTYDVTNLAAILKDDD